MPKVFVHSKLGTDNLIFRLIKLRSCLVLSVNYLTFTLTFFSIQGVTMSDEDRMRSEIASMQMRGDELTDQVIRFF